VAAARWRMRAVNPSSVEKAVNNAVPGLNGHGRPAKAGPGNGRGVGRGGHGRAQPRDRTDGHEGGGDGRAQTRIRIPAGMHRAGIAPAEPGQRSVGLPAYPDG
jgi:hypothetical protein